uniref:Uncharacterized protein n=1 Tax=Arundo donax TaxID=35708 RepID=A0A0A9HZT1_ARUDO
MASSWNTMETRAASSQPCTRARTCRTCAAGAA